MLSLVDRLSNTGHPGFVNRTQVSCAGGHATAVRPVCPADLTALSDFFAKLSPQTRYLRFFAPVTPTYALLRLLSGEAANVDAVVAVADGVIVGHAMAADRTRDSLGIRIGLPRYQPPPQARPAIEEVRPLVTAAG